jgi:hypothetical protein
MGKKCQYEVWKGMLAGLTYLTSSTARTLRDSAILVKHVKFEAAPWNVPLHGSPTSVPVGMLHARSTKDDAKIGWKRRIVNDLENFRKKLVLIVRDGGGPYPVWRDEYGVTGNGDRFDRAGRGYAENRKKVWRKRRRAGIQIKAQV